MSSIKPVDLRFRNYPARVGEGRQPGNSRGYHRTIRLRSREASLPVRETRKSRCYLDARLYRQARRLAVSVTLSAIIGWCGRLVLASNVRTGTSPGPLTNAQGEETKPIPCSLLERKGNGVSAKTRRGHAIWYARRKAGQKPNAILPRRELQLIRRLASVLDSRKGPQGTVGPLHKIGEQSSGLC